MVDENMLFRFGREKREELFRNVVVDVFREVVELRFEFVVEDGEKGLAFVVFAAEENSFALLMIALEHGGENHFEHKHHPVVISGVEDADCFEECCIADDHTVRKFIGKVHIRHDLADIFILFVDFSPAFFLLAALNEKRGCIGHVMIEKVVAHDGFRSALCAFHFKERAVEHFSFKLRVERYVDGIVEAELVFRAAFRAFQYFFANKWVVTKAATIFATGVKKCSECDATATVAKVRFAPTAKASKKKIVVKGNAGKVAKLAVWVYDANGKLVKKQVKKNVTKNTVKVAKAGKYTVKVKAYGTNGAKTASVKKTVKVKRLRYG